MQMDGMNCSTECMKMTMEMMNSMMTRMMTFHFSSVVPTGLLFEQWKVNSVGGLVGAIAVSFVLSVVYEGLKSFREWMLWQKMNGEKSEVQSADSEKTPLLAHSAQRMPKHFLSQVFLHVVQSVIHVVQVGMGFLLMLVAMTFNGWLFLAVCFGAGMGYLLFAKFRSTNNFREQSDSCH